MVDVTNEYIYDELKEKLENHKNVVHKKGIICFSGIPGSGKTTIARKLEQQLKAVRISNDDIREVIEATGISDREIREQYKEDFLRFFLTQLEKWNNKLIIIDSGIERRFGKLYKGLHAKGYAFFLINLKTPREVLISRIQKRLNHRAKPGPMIATLDKWISDKQNFEAQYSDYIDITIDTTKSVNFDAIIIAVTDKLKI